MPHIARVVIFRLIPMLAVICFADTGTVGAQGLPIPFGDPQQMFERAFGEDSDEDRKTLEKITVSIEEERKLGKQVLEEGLASLKEAGISVEVKGRDVEYLQSLVATLQPQMRNKKRYKTIQVMVAKSSKVDARSCPGGTLIFFEGLLDAAPNEAALAGIVGHELSHLDRGHQLLPIKRMKLMAQSFSSPQDPSQFMQFGQGMTRLWARPFRPEDEREADRDGVLWSYKAGYDAREMAKLFEAKHPAGNASAEELPWTTFFRSHPYNKERHEAILTQMATLQKEQPPQQPLFIGRENLLKRFSRKQAADAGKAAQ